MDDSLSAQNSPVPPPVPHPSPATPLYQPPRRHHKHYPPLQSPYMLSPQVDTPLHYSPLAYTTPMLMSPASPNMSHPYRSPLLRYNEEEEESNPEDLLSLFVSDLPSEVTPPQISDVFERPWAHMGIDAAGFVEIDPFVITDVRVMAGESGDSKYAFVRFPTPEERNRALNCAQGLWCMGSPSESFILPTVLLDLLVFSDVEYGRALIFVSCHSPAFKSKCKRQGSKSSRACLSTTQEQG